MTPNEKKKLKDKIEASYSKSNLMDSQGGSKKKAGRLLRRSSNAEDALAKPVGILRTEGSPEPLFEPLMEKVLEAIEGIAPKKKETKLNKLFEKAKKIKIFNRKK